MLSGLGAALAWAAAVAVLVADPVHPRVRVNQAAAQAAPDAFVWVLAGAAVTAAVVAAVGGTAVVAALGIVAATLLVRVLLQARERERERVSRRRHALEVCDAWSAELHGGQPAAHALERALEVRAEWAPAARAASLGGDTAEVLRELGERPGAEGLHQLAAAWEVGAEAGAAMADVVSRVADGLRADADARAEIEASLGPPRATAKMLAVLPLFGIALGESMGASPTAFLIGTPLGWLLLGAGASLALLGVVWVERIARGVEV